MDNIALCLEFALSEILRLDRIPKRYTRRPPQIAILCGDNICPREVWKTVDYLNIKPYLYDGGVEYYSYATVQHYPTNPDVVDHSTIQQRADLVQWMDIDEGGILVTHNRQNDY